MNAARLKELNAMYSNIRNIEQSLSALQDTHSWQSFGASEDVAESAKKMIEQDLEIRLAKAKRDFEEA